MAVSEIPQDVPLDLAGAFHEVIEGLSSLPPSFTIELAEPVKFAGTEYTQITLQEPAGDQVRQAEEMLRTGAHLPHNIRNYEMHLVSKASGVPFPVIQKLGVARLNVAMQYLRLFLAYGRGIGAS